MPQGKSSEGMQGKGGSYKCRHLSSLPPIKACMDFGDGGRNPAPSKTEGRNARYKQIKSEAKPH